jgi:rare lipoprotein A
MMNKNRLLAKKTLIILLMTFCSTVFAKAQKDDFFEDQVGVASYFHDSFHGQRTASGEIYNKNDLTAAHATLPFGTLIHVVNLQNNQSVDVRVNSRQHKANRRLLDLSKQAAKRLGILQAGLAKVKITVLRIGEA